MISPSLWVGFALVVLADTALVCYLLWYQGSARGVEPARLRHALYHFVGSIAVAVVAGLAARAVLGGGVIDFSRSPGRSVGLWMRPLQVRQAVALGLALAVMASCLWWALRTIRAVALAPAPPRDPA
jgi:hypothetical protein